MIPYSWERDHMRHRCLVSSHPNKDSQGANFSIKKQSGEYVAKGLSWNCRIIAYEPCVNRTTLQSARTSKISMTFTKVEVTIQLLGCSSWKEACTTDL